MISKIKKPVSILLSLIMVFSVFAIVPLSASAAIGDVPSESEYLTFTAEEADSSVTLNVNSGDNLKYSLNGAGLTGYTPGTKITLANAGDYVRFCGTGTTFNVANHVSLTGKVACSGNVMSLRLDDNGKVQGLASYCFYSMFEACTGLTSAPELPETELAESCYYRMFYGCINLTKAPALPATTLAQNCYYRMFYGCKSLTKAPELPATNLAESCYNNMFCGCESLTELPALPATTLAYRCYLNMFYGCSSICISEEPGTDGDITYSAEYRIPTTGTGTSADYALTNMFKNTGGKFTGTPDINTTYYVPAPAPETFKVKVKKLTGGTYTIENLTGETTVAQLKEIIANQIDIPATAQRLIFAGKQLEDAKTLAEYNIVEESTIHLVIRYTVTWKNWNGDVLETDANVAEGATPSYDGATPVRPEDMNNTYTFAAWDDGKTTYLIGEELPPVTGDVTYTAVYTGETKPLFAGHSVTLGGDIGVNFFIDGNVAGVATAQTAVVKFAWDGGKYIQEVNLKKLTPNADGIYKVTINVVAAQMAHRIEAVAYINGEMIYTADLFSVQEYAETVYANPGDYTTPEKAEALKTLAKALLNYGSEAQTVFADALTVKPERADTNVGTTDYSNVTADLVAAAVNGEASDLAAVAPEFGAKFYTFSLLYLSQNTLRIYFTEDGDKFDPEAFDGSNKNYYYVAKTDIPAAELDELQDFEVSGVPFTFSALDYVKAVIGSSSMTEEQKNLAKSLFLYNQAANAYFDDPAPAGNTVDLSTLEGDKELQNGDVLTGTLNGDHMITIADGATVTLRDANITCLTADAEYAGITPLGNATILLVGTNTVKGGHEDYPGIFAAENATLTIDGEGSLDASSNGYGCGIGGGFYIGCGNIIINGGTVTATGGECAAGIGSGDAATCGNITINGGTITANGGECAAGIGSGYDATCGNITINGGTVTAIGGDDAPGIGGGADASCGNITITDTVTMVTATKGGDESDSIGAGKFGTCGDVTIAPGANVTQN